MSTPIITDERFFDMVRAELQRARAKFPAETNPTNATLVEEVGEVSKALLCEPWENVIAESVQVAAMACRMATEGDATMVEFRRSQGLGCA